jgi:assimilatory nitrate reductase catalytic subunit
VFGGASLITEKAYLLGKFARLALGTRHIDYNGRLCMVSAGTAYKLVFNVDRSPIPWSDIAAADNIFVIGANVGECAPITTDYIWRARDHGARLIVADPRMTPITRNADLYLPLRPGTDLVLLMSMLHVVLRDNLEDRAFIAEHTSGFEAVAESVRSYDPRSGRRAHRRPPESIEKAARWFAEGPRSVAMHARGIEHQSKGVENVLALINLTLATWHGGTRRLRLHDDHWAGQRSRRPRTRPEVRSAPGRPIHFGPRGARPCRQGVGRFTGRDSSGWLVGAGNHECDPRG